MGMLARIPARPVGNGACPSKPPSGEPSNRNSFRTLFPFLRICGNRTTVYLCQLLHQKIPSIQTPLAGCETCLSFWITGTNRRKSMRNGSQPANVNITLEGSDKRQNTMLGKFFPCPVCAVSLPIRIARTQKPYCVCIDCGIQIFVRGKTGIARLRAILEDKMLVTGAWSGTNTPELLFNRIQHLKRRKSELEQKQRLLFPDSDLENA